MNSGAIALIVVIGIVCGVTSAGIAERKNASVGGVSLLGFLLGPIGIIAAVLAPAGKPAAPDGMVAVRCPRCNADQNVAKDVSTVRLLAVSPSGTAG